VLFDRITIISIVVLALFVIVGFPVYSLYMVKKLKKEIQQDKKEIERLVEKNKRIEDEHEHPLVKRVNDLQKIRFAKDISHSVVITNKQDSNFPVRPRAVKVLKKG